MGSYSHAEMLRTIEQQVALTREMRGRHALSPLVMQAMAEVPRDAFVPSALRSDAFGNFPLPIGSGQTISQPFMVALMTDLLELTPEDKVLEIGTGSGYQAAVLSLLVNHVYSLEVLPELAEAARLLLEQLGYRNVTVRNADGYRGWEEYAPFDAVMVTAAAPALPQALVGQLKTGGRMVIPIGEPYRHQELWLVEKSARGEIRHEEVLAVAFVPMVHGH